MTESITSVPIGTLSNSNKQRFTKEQIDYLSRLYPERIMPHNASHSEVMYYQGQRSVVLMLAKENGGV